LKTKNEEKCADFSLKKQFDFAKTILKNDEKTEEKITDCTYFQSTVVSFNFENTTCEAKTAKQRKTTTITQNAKNIVSAIGTVAFNHFLPVKKGCVGVFKNYKRKKRTALECPQSS